MALNVIQLRPRIAFALLAFAALSILWSGVLLGEIKNLHPCHLCNLQRLIYMGVAFFGLGGVVFPSIARVWATLAGLTALGGVVAAGQQSLMQYAPGIIAECGFGEPTLAESLVNWLGTQWPEMFMVMGRCTEQEWSFLGLSLANWSGLCFLALCLMAGLIFSGRILRKA